MTESILSKFAYMPIEVSHSPSAAAVLEKNAAKLALTETNRRRLAAKRRKARNKNKPKIFVEIESDVTVSVSIRITTQSTTQSAVKREAEEFEDNPHALAYHRSSDPYRGAAFRGTRRI